MADTITPDPTVQAAVNGDREAFGRLWDRHHGDVTRFIRSKVRDRVLTEDLTNETFYRALRAIKTWDRDGPGIENWLITIAHNLVRGHHRYLSRHPTSTLPVLYDRPAPDNVEYEAITRITALDVLRAISRLRGSYRSVMLLRFLDGLTRAETAAVMGRSVSAVSSLQELATRRLRMELDGARHLPRELERANRRAQRRSPAAHSA
jgi:RNA polymerase sigma-70 factor (ECF subfamily)